MQTCTPHNIHRDGQEDSEGHRDDTGKQPKTTQSQSNSVVAVICFSLPQDHLLRPEHVNWAKWMGAKREQRGGCICLCLGRTDSNTPPVLFGWSPVCPSASETRCRQMFPRLEESNHRISFPSTSFWARTKKWLASVRKQAKMIHTEHYIHFPITRNIQIHFVWSKSSC